MKFINERHKEQEQVFEQLSTGAYCSQKKNAQDISAWMNGARKGSCFWAFSVG